MRFERALLTVLVLLASCGVREPRGGGQQGIRPGGSEPVSGIARVVCQKDGTQVLTPRVRAHRDGIHVLFINRGGLDEFYMRNTNDPDENHGGFLRKRRQLDIASHPPGRMWVGCFEKGDYPQSYYGGDERYAEFEVVDPRDLWIPLGVTCDSQETLSEKRVEGAENIDDVEAWLRDKYDLPSESVRMRPGYPETQWKGNPWVLVKDDETVAYFSAFKDDTAWRITVGEVCT